MLSGRYPADEFSELRPRIVWDRRRGLVRAREGTQKVVVANAGTIPDRGLFGVFLAGGEGAGRRVGELDEEMVFESREGDVFVLGASSWRIVGITHDRVLVQPAPGEPGEMPFWKADRGSRPVELGRAIGKLTRELQALPRPEALERLEREHAFDARAARNLVQYLDDQRQATGSLPDDRTLVLERTRDEMGDWRLCLLSPWGGRVHAPWTIALRAWLRERGELELESIWSDDGIVLRMPERERPPAAEELLPDPEATRAAGGARAAGDEPLRRSLPRGRRPRAAAAAPAAGPALAAVDAAQARARAAAGGGALSRVPDRARGGARVPARRVRPPGARRAGADACGSARSAW